MKTKLINAINKYFISKAEYRLKNNSMFNNLKQNKDEKK